MFCGFQCYNETNVNIIGEIEKCFICRVNGHANFHLFSELQFI